MNFRFSWNRFVRTMLSFSFQIELCSKLGFAYQIDTFFEYDSWKKSSAERRLQVLLAFFGAAAHTNVNLGNVEWFNGGWIDLPSVWASEWYLHYEGCVFVSGRLTVTCSIVSQSISLNCWCCILSCTTCIINSQWANHELHWIQISSTEHLIVETTEAFYH